MSHPTTARGRPTGSTSTRLRRRLRRMAVTVAGTAVVAAGMAMLVLPGPGLVTIALGLSLLGREHTWAAALEQRIRVRLVAAAQRVAPRLRISPVTPPGADHDELPDAA